MINIHPSKDYQSLHATFNYSGEDVDLTKTILKASAKYKELKVGTSTVKKFSHWQIEPTEESRSILESIRSDKRFNIDPGAWEIFEAMRERRESNYVLSNALNYDLEVKGLGGTLRNFQKATVKYIFDNARGVLVGDEMGLGKTVEALAAVEYGERYPLLIVCPAVVKYNWFKECIKWLPGRSVSIIGGYKNEPSEWTEIRIINYDLLEKYFESLNSYEWHTIILDESHFLKNYKAQRTKLITELSKNIPSRILLSGTPILNRPQELLSQLQIMDRLNDFGGFWPFANRYCQATQKTIRGEKIWDMSGAANQDELNERLRKTCYVRHDKKEVLPDLPEKTRVELWERITNGPDYEKAESDLLQYLKENAIIPPELEIESDEVKQEFRNTAAYKASRAQAIVKINVLKQLVARGKYAAAVSWIRNYFESKDKLVVFCWHTELIQALQEELKKSFVVESITGDTPAKQRDLCIERFQSGGLQILICNIQAGGVGITLTASDTTLFLELGWNPGTMDQAEDRIYRMGQRNATTIYYMLGEGTIDSAIWAMIKAKRETIDSALDGFEFVKEYLHSHKIGGR